MSKITLNDVTNIGSLTVINDNFDRIEQELQSKVLYRDNPVGEPNVMENSIDMNGFDILNAGQVFSAEGRWATIDELEDIQAEVETARDNTIAARDEAIVAADSASASNVEVQSIYDNFDDRYLGQKASDPSVDNDGGMLLTGALYFKTSGTPIMRVYNGTTWQDVGSITTTTTNLIDPTLYSSQAEAEAGANNTKVMTPLRVKNAIDKQVKEGFTSTGAITLPGNASSALQAVPKQQAESIATSAANSAQAAAITSAQATQLGVGQSWQNMTSSRALATNYTNDTGRPIMVSVRSTATNPTTGSVLSVGGLGVDISGGGGIGWSLGVSTVVPAGAVYRVDNINASLTTWTELR